MEVLIWGSGKHNHWPRLPEGRGLHMGMTTQQKPTQDYKNKPDIKDLWVMKTQCTTKGYPHGVSKQQHNKC